jgi:hypothetical protein
MMNAKNESRSRFPTVKGSNLQRESITLPDDFEGDLNIVLVPFQRWQQNLVDTWVGPARALEEDNPRLRYYELPTIESKNWLSRTFINEGMRAGIPDQTACQRTITLYLDKERFKEALDIDTEKTIHVFLVDQAGGIIWRERGEYISEKGRSLLAAIESYL